MQQMAESDNGPKGEFSFVATAEIEHSIE